MSVATKIFSGMGLLISLIIAVSVTAFLTMNNSGRLFDSFQHSATSSLLANDLAIDLYDARMASLKYRTEGGTEQVSALRKNMDDLRQRVAQFLEVEAEEEERAQFDAIVAGSEAYENSFLQAVALQERRNSVVAGIIETGKIAREQLSEVMLSANDDGDTVAAYLAGISAKDLLLGRIYVERFLVTNDRRDFETANGHLESAKSNLDVLLPELQNPERRELVIRTMSDLDDFTDASAEAAATILERNANYDDMDRIGPEILSRVVAIVAANEAYQSELGAQSVDAKDRNQKVVGAIAIAGVLAGIALAFFIGRSITRPILGMTQNMTDMAEGDLEIEIKGQKDPHEIGRMARALEVFRENTKKARDLAEAREEADRKAREEEQRIAAERAEMVEKERKIAEETAKAAEVELQRVEAFKQFQKDMHEIVEAAAGGEFSKRMATDLPDESLQGLAGFMNDLLEALETSFGDLASHMSKLSAGQLSARMTGTRHGAFADLQNSFNDTLQSLSETVGQISTSSGSVGATAAELEAASMSMSRVAETNAASLEETSAAVEEISRSIESVVDNAHKARESTEKVQASAEQGREVANKTRDAMAKMTEASEQIERVIGVIEEIAFQINLLALNAGVEAARAGEAGRGFSVVASEVRALAQRSQDAVQEINRVIDENGRSVETSVTQVRHSQDALETIIADVVVASDQINAITTAVEEQSTGIQEINRTIQSLDTSAQKNAASIEELSASSTLLNNESKVLQGVLSQFQTSEDHLDTEPERASA